MIATPAAKLTLLQGSRFATHLRVQIADADGAFRDYSNLSGVDWQEGAEWGKTVDSPVADGIVELRRAVGNLSLAPLVEGSTLNRNGANAYAPAVDIGRRVLIDVQVTDAGAAPVGTDWVRVHDGIIQRVSWAGPVLQLSTLDRASLLQKKIITTKRTYGSAGGTAVQTVIQQIIDDNMGTGVFTLQVPTDPGFMVQGFVPYEVSVWDAIQQLTAQFAGYVEYRSDLTLVVPNRTAPTALSAVATIGPEHYKDVSRLEYDLASIRNRIVVRYRSRASGAEAQEEASDSGSVTAYGEQVMVITEGDASEIDTSAEALDMASRIRDDVSAPLASQQIRNWFWYPVELGDHITWKANGKHYDVDKHWAVTGYRHRLRADSRETTFDVRGKAVGGYRRFLRFEIPTRPNDTHPWIVATTPTFKDQYFEVTFRGGQDTAAAEWSADGATWNAIAGYSATDKTGTVGSNVAAFQVSDVRKPVYLRGLDAAGRPGLATRVDLQPTKKLTSRRLTHHAFRPHRDTVGYTAAINNTTLTGSAGQFADFFAPLDLPRGVIITRVTIRGAEGDALNTVQASVIRQNADDTTTTLATATVGTAAVSQQGTDLTTPETVSDLTYLIDVYLNWDAGAVTAPSFYWVDVAYTSPDFLAAA